MGIGKKNPIQQIIIDYFSDLFQTSVDADLSDRKHVQTILRQHNEALIRDITSDEVKEAVFRMHPDKSLVPDGLNPAFFPDILEYSMS